MLPQTRSAAPSSGLTHRSAHSAVPSRSTAQASRCWSRARVEDLDGLPVTTAEIITWQANAEGYYENQQPDLQPEFNLRGLFHPDQDGRFHYRTVRPAGYGVPGDGPVGRLFAQAGYPLHRPAHLHFVVRAPGFETITTHIYDADDPSLAKTRCSVFGRNWCIRSSRP